MRGSLADTLTVTGGRGGVKVRWNCFGAGTADEPGYRRIATAWRADSRGESGLSFGQLPGRAGRRNLEAAPRALAAIAAFAHRGVDQIGEHRLHRAADLGALMHRGGEKAAPPSQHVAGAPRLQVVERAQIL